MEQIAPLAKILAEANGIEWQQLRGSGAGGTVVEQDILNYLSRIMSGEEEPPSTPVDETPEGWTGDEQLPAGMFSADMLSQAGIDSDIAEFVTQTRAPETPVHRSEPALSHDSMEFELDDDMADLDAPLAAEPAAQPAASTWPWNPAHAGAQHPAAEAAFPSLDAPEVAAVEIAQVEVVPVAPAASAPATGLGSLLSRLYSKDKAEPAAPPSAAVTPVEAVAPVEVAPAEMAPVEYAAPVIPVPVAATAPEAYVAELVTPELDAPEFEAPELHHAELEEYLAPEVVAEQPAAQQPGVQSEVQPMAASAVQQAALPADAIWFGSYLRRDANVAAAHDLSAQLSEALGKDVSLAFLVARAAQRHAATLALDLGHVALRGAGGQEYPITGAALRDAVNAISDHSAAPDLLVTDAGALGLDDLHYPHTLTLSLGRVQDGRAALSLNGDVDPRQAAHFLARVAATLEKPIALVL